MKSFIYSKWGAVMGWVGLVELIDIPGNKNMSIILIILICLLQQCKRWINTLSNLSCLLTFENQFDQFEWNKTYLTTETFSQMSDGLLLTLQKSEVILLHPKVKL